MKKDMPNQELLKHFYVTNLIIKELEMHRKWAERTLFLAGIVSAAMAIPQILTIIRVQDSSQISLMAWAYYGFVNVLWIVYAFVFKRPIVKRVQVIYLLSNILVIGVTMYFR